MSSSQSPRRSPEPEQKSKPNKVFVTNLEVDVATAKIEQELWQKFSKFGKLDSVVVKKSYNNQYSFAFIEYKEGQDAASAVNELDNTSLLGKKMKVQLQDNSRRRKGGNQTCYNCGKSGHYARNCRQHKEREGNDRRKSHSEEKRHKKSKKKRHHRSQSSDSSSRHKKKQKKSKKVKKHSSKHKKDRKRSESDSSA